MSHRTRIPLDGQWFFSTTGSFIDGGPITVPAPWQADPRYRDHIGEAWYQRELEVLEEWLKADRVVILGFGAVDYFAEVWVNDIRVGEHEGGYLPFELDITQVVQAGTNTLTVRVDDPLELFDQIPHGKQSWYGMLSGIWQPAWMESRAATHLQRVKVRPHGDEVAVELIVRGNISDGLTAEIFDPNGRKVAAVNPSGPRFSLHVDHPLSWSPDQPNLYTLKVSLREDELTETFGFRTIETRDGQILLNGRPFYLRGALDQDYYPELISAPPSLEYIEDEFRKAKEMGLNCLRVHIKVADPRYYIAADKVGLLIWTELPNHILLSRGAQRRARETIAGMLERDGNHPSIGIWTIINESWGIDLTDPAQRAWLVDTYRWLKELDPTRLVVGNSACWGNFHVATDIADFHMYYAMPDHHEKWRQWTAAYMQRPWWLFAHDYPGYQEWRAFLRDPWSVSERPTARDAQPRGNEPLLVSEFGNWGLPDIEKIYQENGGRAPWWFETGLEWGEGIVYPHEVEGRFRDYHLDRVFPSLSALFDASQRVQRDALKFQIETMRAHASIQGYVITEFTDVHWESNGLLDMYRNPKSHYAELCQFNADDVLIPRWERLTYRPGETCELNLWLSHYSEIEIKEPVLAWQVSAEGFSASGTQHPADECSAFGVTELGSVRFEMPRVKDPTVVHLEIRLMDGDHSIAYTEEELYVFPEQPVTAGDQPVYSPQFQTSLHKLGYAMTEDLTQAKVAVVTQLDDSYRSFLQNGGRVLLLAEDEQALQTHIPSLTIEKREGTIWQGDWASSFGWHRFTSVPTGGTVNFAFAELTPEHVIGGFSPRDFAFHVYAGLFVGWLHKPIPTIARRRLADGEVLVSTFHLSKNLESNPLAMHLFAELMTLLLTPPEHPAQITD